LLARENIDPKGLAGLATTKLWHSNVVICVAAIHLLLVLHVGIRFFRLITTPFEARGGDVSHDIGMSCYVAATPFEARGGDVSHDIGMSCYVAAMGFEARGGDVSHDIGMSCYVAATPFEARGGDVSHDIRMPKLR
jgi:hypothetical protein